MVSSRRLPRLVYLVKLRWLIERGDIELKQGIGLGHYEGRGWRGFHHHAALCIAAYGFLVAERAAIPPSAVGAGRLVQAPSLPDGYRPRGDMENRIKEQQLDLFADRTSTATMRANQLRRWFSSFAYVLIEALQRIGLGHTEFANATAGTIRLKLLKIGARVSVSVRRIKIAMASAYPFQIEFALAHARMRAPPA